MIPHIISVVGIISTSVSSADIVVAQRRELILCLLARLLRILIVDVSIRHGTRQSLHINLIRQVMQEFARLALRTYTTQPEAAQRSI